MRFYPPKTTTIIREANTLESGELIYDIDTQKLYIGDGTTLGGIEVGTGTGGINVLVDGANISIDASNSDTFEVTLAGDRILDNPINIYDGQKITIYIIQDGTGSRTLSYGTNYKFPGGILPTLSTAAGSIDKLECRVRNGNLLCDFTANYS